MFLMKNWYQKHDEKMNKRADKKKLYVHFLKQQLLSWKGKQCQK
jgi:RNA binding exosome subunit